VSVVRAVTGAGSGEVEVDWDAVPGVTGYRVVRPASGGDPPTVMVELDITTGTATALPAVVNVWSDEHTYVPPRDPMTGTDTSVHFHYVDVGGPGQRCYQVVAFNAAGAAAPSGVVCAPPP
jgi:hypothetical protein